MSEKETVENLKKIQHNQQTLIGLIVAILIGGGIFYLVDKKQKEAEREKERMEEMRKIQQKSLEDGLREIWR